ncbi:MAG: hypothetical protein R3C11_24435 [Planctomycetaceae bacterium]
MSSINSVTDSTSLIEILKASQNSPLSGASAPPPPPDSEQFEARITDSLKEAGVDDETAAVLKSELSAAFEEFKSSGEFNPAAHKDKIDSIFAEHGLNAEDILGPRAEKVQSGECSGHQDAFTANLTTLLETLFSSDAEGSTSTEAILNGLFGLDATA